MDRGVWEFKMQPTIRIRYWELEFTCNSDRALMIQLFNNLDRGVPNFALRVATYMTNEVMPVKRAIKNPLFARTRDELSTSQHVQKSAIKLRSGWYAHTHECAASYKIMIKHIESALGLKIEVWFTKDD